MPTAADAPIRICLLTEYFNPGSAGGTPAMLPALARTLRARYPALTIDVVTSRNVYRGDACLPAYEEWEGMRVFRLNSPRSNTPSTLKRLVMGTLFSLRALGKLLTLPRYDLLLVGTNPPMAPVAAQAVRRLRGTPYVYLIHDLFPDVAVALHTLPAASAPARLCGRLQRGWLHGAARVVVIGRCMQAHLQRQYALPFARTAIIPNWSDPESIRPLAKETHFRAQHGLSGFVVLYAGNFGQYQNFDTLLLAAKRLQTTHPAITFALVGEGARREYLETYIREDGLQNVRLFPFVAHEAFADLLASADVSLVTLEPGAEGVGVPSKFYNILASGRPTIALVGPESEVACVVEEAQCGLRADQGDAEGFADAILQLYQAPELAARMGEQARTTLVTRFSLEQITTQFHEVFRAVHAGIQPGVEPHLPAER